MLIFTKLIPTTSNNLGKLPGEFCGSQLTYDFCNGFKMFPLKRKPVPRLQKNEHAAAFDNSGTHSSVANWC